MAFPPDVRNTYLHMPNSAMACVANCSLRETGLHIIIEFNTIITKEAIASNSSWICAKKDVIIKAEGVGSASETKRRWQPREKSNPSTGALSCGRASSCERSCVLPLGAPARGRAHLSNPPGALGAPAWGRALVSDPPLLRRCLQATTIRLCHGQKARGV